MGSIIWRMIMILSSAVHVQKKIPTIFFSLTQKKYMNLFLHILFGGNHEFCTKYTQSRLLIL